MDTPTSPSRSLAATLPAIDADRLWRSLMDLAALGATPRGGVCRLALTDVHTPPEIAAEVLIELMAHLRMQLHQLAAGATNEPSRQQFEEAEWAIYDMRLAFDPHDRHSVHAMRQRMLRYSGQVELGLAPTIGASGLPQ